MTDAAPSETDPKIARAFAHPEARAARLRADAAPPDRISLRGHVRAIEVGAFEAERGTRQRVRFDVVVEVHGPGPAGRADRGGEANRAGAARSADEAGDDVDRILSYDEITGAIDAALAAGRADLLETLAERVAAAILGHPLAARAFVRLQKLDRGPGALGVEIVRSAAAAATSAGRARPVPDVRLTRPDAPPGDLAGPVILVPVPAEISAPTGNAAVDRRLALLDLDRAAWRLAATHPAATVRASRTEIEWALGRRAPTIWAPARMVLGAARPPEAVTPEALAAWLGDALGA